MIDVCSIRESLEDMRMGEGVRVVFGQNSCVLVSEFDCEKEFI